MDNFLSREMLSVPVSYTHLDVYKRQVHRNGAIQWQIQACVGLAPVFDKCQVGICFGSGACSHSAAFISQHIEKKQPLLLRHGSNERYSLGLSFRAPKGCGTIDRKTESPIMKPCLSTCLLYTSRCV